MHYVIAGTVALIIIGGVVYGLKKKSDIAEPKPTEPPTTGGSGNKAL